VTAGLTIRTCFSTSMISGLQMWNQLFYVSAVFMQPNDRVIILCFSLQQCNYVVIVRDDEFRLVLITHKPIYTYICRLILLGEHFKPKIKYYQIHLRNMHDVWLIKMCRKESVFSRIVQVFLRKRREYSWGLTVSHVHASNFC
jgi:predicted cation transporter